MNKLLKDGKLEIAPSVRTPSEDIFIREDANVKDALKALDRCGKKVLIVVDDQKRMLGAITDGDVRRHILKGHGLDDGIKKVYNKKAVFIKEQEFSMESVRKIMLKKQIELVPIIDQSQKVVDYISWEKAFADAGGERPVQRQALGLPVVIMAGGKGTRLEPFSKIFPKPLIPVGEKPIVEIIIGEFKRQGINTFYLTLNYKGEMVKSYFDYVEKDYEIRYVWENDFLGTASSLKLIDHMIEDVFIVSNCDVIVDADMREVLDYHKKQGAVLTVLSSIRHHKVPYGVVDFKEGGIINNIIEKPEYSFMINTGVYVMNKETLQLIPQKERYDMTDLIRDLIKNGQKVVTYPVNENAYIDVGQWEEYKQAKERLKLLE